MQTDRVQIVSIAPVRVWIESDILGSRHVMVQHEAEGQQPFCYCTFHYSYAYTSNAQTMRDAVAMALAIGATEPVKCVNVFPKESGDAGG